MIRVLIRDIGTGLEPRWAAFRHIWVILWHMAFPLALLTTGHYFILHTQREEVFIKNNELISLMTRSFINLEPTLQ